MIPWCCSYLVYCYPQQGLTLSLSLSLSLSVSLACVWYSFTPAMIYTQRSQPDSPMGLRIFLGRRSYPERATRTGHSQTCKPNSSISNPMGLRIFLCRRSYHERATRTGHSQTCQPNSSISNPNGSSLEGWWEGMAEYLTQAGYASVDWPSYRMLRLEHSYPRVLPSAPPILPHPLSGPQPLRGFSFLVDYQPSSLGVLLVPLIFLLV